MVSADAAQVVSGADVVLIPLPSFSHESTLREIGPSAPRRNSNGYAHRFIRGMRQLLDFCEVSKI